MSADRIHPLYGADDDVQRHTYVEGAKYLRIAVPADDGVLVFDTDAQSRITQWHADIPPRVNYGEVVVRSIQ